MVARNGFRLACRRKPRNNSPCLVKNIHHKYFDTHLNLKGLCHGFNTDLKSQDTYLCRRKPKIMVHFFKQLLYQSTETVNMHLWLRMARMETDYNLKKLG